MSKLCGGMLHRESELTLEQAAQDLDLFRASKARASDWQIPEASPLKTRVSAGEYRPTGGGGSQVEGTLSFKWEISKDAQHSDTFILSGNGSTSIGILSVADDGAECTFRWTFDIGADSAPGCHFHAYVAVPGSADLDVPRLPTPFVLPSDALDFLLGELFQADWLLKQHQRTIPVKRVTVGQRDRLRRMLEASVAQFTAGASQLTPWMSYKQWKPHQAIFMP